MNDKPKPTIEMVTLKQLCAELKVDPREALGHTQSLAVFITITSGFRFSVQTGSESRPDANAPASRDG